MKFLSALPLLLLTWSNPHFHSGICGTNAFTVTTTTTHTRAAVPTTSVVSPRQKKLTFLSSAAPSDVEASSEEDEQDETDDAANNTTPQPTMIPNRPTLSARDEMVRTALDLTDASPTGLFLTVPSQASDFIRAVARLEAVAPSTNDESEALSIGDWTLVATCKRTKFPSPQPTTRSKQDTAKEDGNGGTGGGLDDFLSSLSLPKPTLPTKSKFTKDLQKSITVTQRIRSITDASQSTNTIDRIDHVIAFDNQVSETSTLLPPILNPLQINQSKFTLVHKAKVQSFVPFLTSLQLQSVIVNVAGEEGNALKLDPKGADVLGINIPQLNDWMNGGQFETTYVDGNVRVSRGTSGVLEETRVFVKEGFNLDSLLVKESEDTLDTTETEEEEEETSNSNSNEPTNQLKKVATAVGSVVDALDKTREDVRSTIQSDLEVTAQDVQKVLEEDLKTVEEAITSVKSAVIANDELEDAVDSVVGAVGDLGKDVKDVVDGAMGDLKTKVDDDTKKIQSAVEDVKSVVEGKSKEKEGEEVASMEDEDENEDEEGEEETAEEEGEEKDNDVTAEKTKPEEKSDEK